MPGQRVQVERVFMKTLDKAQLRLVAQTPRVAGHGVHHRGGGAGGVLRIERHGQDALAALRAQPADRVRDRRVAIAHAQFHRRVHARLAQRRGHALGLAAAVDHQRRAVLQPDTGVARRQLLRAQGQHQAMQYRLPQIARNFDHARVGQEFAQVLADIPGRGSVRGAQVHQQHADLARRARRRILVEGIVLLRFGQVAFGPQVLEQAKKHKNSPSSARRMQL